MGQSIHDIQRFESRRSGRSMSTGRIYDKTGRIQQNGEYVKRRPEACLREVPTSRAVGSSVDRRVTVTNTGGGVRRNLAKPWNLPV